MAETENNQSRAGSAAGDVRLAEDEVAELTALEDAVRAARAGDVRVSEAEVRAEEAEGRAAAAEADLAGVEERFRVYRELVRTLTAQLKGGGGDGQ